MSLAVRPPFAYLGEAPVPDLRIYVLGGLRVETDGVPISESAWQMRRTARALVKLLTCVPAHSLHRDQVLEFLWPQADPDSAANSFSKALHAARRALEPNLAARGQSSYLQLKNDLLILNTEHTWLDVDHFERLAHEALRRDDIPAYEAAVAAYPGELLPEDRYEAWVQERSATLEALAVQVLLAGADALQRQGAYSQAVEWLRRALQHDETREDIHRSIMRVSYHMRNRHQALRQYHRCREILLRELEVEPEPETEALYEDIRANRLEKATPVVDLDTLLVTIPPLLKMWGSISTPLIGRDRVVERLQAEMIRAEEGNGGVVLVSGEAGVGKTRVIAEFAHKVVRRGVLVLWGTSGVHDNLMPYWPIVEALDSYVARLPVEERKMLAARYPEMTRLLPSLGLGISFSSEAPGGFDHARLFPAIVCLLSDLAWTRPLLLILSDVHHADTSTIQLIQYLTRLAIQRRWLVVATYRDGPMPPRSELRQMLGSRLTGRLCRTIELRCLARHDSDRLVAALLPNGLPDESLLESLYALSLGNPLFIEELLRTMQEREELTLADGRWHISSPPRSVPRQVRNLVEESIGHLSEETHRVLALASVADTTFNLEALQAAAATLRPPLDDGALLDALDQALEAGILEECGECDDCYTFAHPLVRAALQEQLSFHRRSQFRAALALPAQ